MWTIFHDHMSDTNYCLVSLSSRPDRFPLPVSLQGRVHLCTPCKQTNVTPWFHSSGHVFIRLGFPARIAAATQQFLHGFTSQAMSFPVMIAAAYIVVFTLVFSSGHVLNKVAKLSVAYLEVSFLSKPEPGSPVGGSLGKPSSVLCPLSNSVLCPLSSVLCPLPSCLSCPSPLTSTTVRLLSRSNRLDTFTLSRRDAHCAPSTPHT